MVCAASNTFIRPAFFPYFTRIFITSISFLTPSTKLLYLCKIICIMAWTCIFKITALMHRTPSCFSTSRATLTTSSIITITTIHFSAHFICLILISACTFFKISGYTLLLTTILFSICSPPILSMNDLFREQHHQTQNGERFHFQILSSILPRYIDRAMILISY